MTELNTKRVIDFLGVHPQTVINMEKDMTGLEPECFDKFPFSGREDYLAWVQEWKGLLKEVESCIRDMKRNRFGEEASMAQFYAHIYKQHAHALLIRRRLGKRVSAQMREQSLALVSA